MRDPTTDERWTLDTSDVRRGSHCRRERLPADWERQFANAPRTCPSTSSCQALTSRLPAVDRPAVPNGSYRPSSRRWFGRPSHSATPADCPKDAGRSLTALTCPRRAGSSLRHRSARLHSLRTAWTERRRELVNAARERDASPTREGANPSNNADGGSACQLIRARTVRQQMGRRRRSVSCRQASETPCANSTSSIKPLPNMSIPSRTRRT